MKLVYKCLHCGAASDWKVPDNLASRFTCADLLAAALDQYAPGPYIANWIRHPCELSGVHGVAHLVAILEK